jgi:hypothetical protein
MDLTNLKFRYILKAIRRLKMSRKIDFEIRVGDVLQLEDYENYKLHLGSWNGYDRPLDLYI